jgi:PAS domain S-box-containing protein
MPSSRLTSGETRAILEAIFESAVDGIIVIDARAIVEAFNPGAERLFGYTEKKWWGRTSTC